MNLQPGNQSDRQQDWELLGWVTEKIAYGYEAPPAKFSRSKAGLNQVETSIFLQLDWQPTDNLNLRASAKSYHDLVYRIDDDVPWSTEERRKRRNRYEIRDLYLESRLNGQVYLKAGNQIFAWGMAEYLRVIDVINPEDQLTLGQQDLEDIRQQVPAVLAGFNAGDWLLETVFTYRAGADDLAPARNEFDQLIDLRDAGLLIDRQSPAQSWEYFLRASTHYANGDLQLVAGDFNANQYSLSGIRGAIDDKPIVSLEQQRMQLLGAAANYVNGPWLLFGETGIHFNRPVVPDNQAAIFSASGWREKNQYLMAVGAEYNGFSNLVLSLELDSQRVINHEDTRTASRQQNSFGTRFYWTSRNERLQVLGVWNRLLEGRGYVTRLTLEHSLTDQFSIGALWVDYSADDSSLLHNFRNNDVIQLQLRYSFQN